jgi:hypothetical protein
MIGTWVPLLIRNNIKLAVMGVPVGAAVGAAG